VRLHSFIVLFGGLPLRSCAFDDSKEVTTRSNAASTQPHFAPSFSFPPLDSSAPAEEKQRAEGEHEGEHEGDVE